MNGPPVVSIERMLIVTEKLRQVALELGRNRAAETIVRTARRR